jgi:hypothetical protein
MADILLLPNEIIEEIIRSFSLKDILNFFKVCRRFNEFTYLLNEADKEWDIDDVINKNPFLLPLAKRLINVKSIDQIKKCKQLISVIFNFENTLILNDSPNIRELTILFEIRQLIKDQSKNSKDYISTIKKISYSFEKNEIIIFDFVFTDPEIEHTTEIWNRQKIIKNEIVSNEQTKIKTCDCEICKRPRIWNDCSPFYTPYTYRFPIIPFPRFQIEQVLASGCHPVSHNIMKHRSIMKQNSALKLKSLIANFESNEADFLHKKQMDKLTEKPIHIPKKQAKYANKQKIISNYVKMPKKQFARNNMRY